MLKILYAGCLVLSPAISAQFTLEMHVAAQNCKKFIKTPYFGGSVSFKVISKKLVMIIGISVPICNHFHVRRANSGRITSF